MGKSKRRLKKRLNRSRQRKDVKQVQGRNHHHLTPRSRGGKSTSKNLLLIDIEKHQCWHKIFGLKTIEEVIAELQRLARMKGRGTMKCDRCKKEITDPYRFDEIIGGNYCRKCSSILYQEWWNEYFRGRKR